MHLNDSELYRICKNAEFDNPTENLRLAQHLIQLMMRERGIGLAANQAGVNVRLFVMYVEREIFHCFNPEILETGDELVSMKEGCLSFPGERCDLTRPDRILVKFANARGQTQERQLTGMSSRCFQHELDHLNGITMHQRVKESV